MAPLDLDASDCSIDSGGLDGHSTDTIVDVNAVVFNQGVISIDSPTKSNTDRGKPQYENRAWICCVGAFHRKSIECRFVRMETY